MKYIVALDQGTTSSRAVVFDEAANLIAAQNIEFEQLYPNPGWVEHRPSDILNSQVEALKAAVQKSGVDVKDIAAIGITNQRETTIVWDKASGKPIANAIVWQCRRTAPLVAEICNTEDICADVCARTGLHPDAYFSASKIRWILDNVAGAKARAEAGELAFGTVDSWLIWNLTGATAGAGAVHATDRTNASRTMLYNIHEAAWDDTLLSLFDVPRAMMPEVLPSSALFGRVASGPLAGVPICGVAGDQQSALFGQCCFESGQAKNTYGTGCFLLMHTGEDARVSTHNLVTTIAATAPAAAFTPADKVEDALEGSVFIAGALVKWMVEELGILESPAASAAVAMSVEDTEGVYVVPAFTGLGAPYWDADARGAILGLTRGAGRAHIVRAGLEALAYQVADLVSAMEADAGRKLDVLNVDGGASANNFIMQFQADLLDTLVRRPRCTETTALGAAYLAGLFAGFWQSTDELKGLRASDTLFRAAITPEERQEKLAGWHKAVARVRTQGE